MINFNFYPYINGSIKQRHNSKILYNNLFSFLSVTFFSLFRNERKKSNQKKESAKGYRIRVNLRYFSSLNS